MICMHMDLAALEAHKQEWSLRLLVTCNSLYTVFLLLVLMPSGLPYDERKLR